MSEAGVFEANEISVLKYSTSIYLLQCPVHEFMTNKYTFHSAIIRPNVIRSVSLSMLNITLSENDHAITLNSP